MKINRRIAVLLGAALLLVSQFAAAHHGWRWTDDGKFELIAVIEKATLGNPHGVLILDAEGEKWTAEVGQPWRNDRAGLTDAMLVKGAEITIIGKRSTDPKERKVKAERVVIKGKAYDLYPERLKEQKE
jgi:hypothetical protein